LIFTSDGVWWYNAPVCTAMSPQMPKTSACWRLCCPGLAPESVFYQIFPDRFADGDPASNVRDGEFVYGGHPALAAPWGRPPSHAPRLWWNFTRDLPGIVQHLPTWSIWGERPLPESGLHRLQQPPLRRRRLRSRGPAPGRRPACALRRATLEQGFRYLLDIVPNHCGLAHPGSRPRCRPLAPR